jgi:hypothetical protein
LIGLQTLRCQWWRLGIVEDLRIIFYWKNKWEKTLRNCFKQKWKNLRVSRPKISKSSSAFWNFIVCNCFEYRFQSLEWKIAANQTPRKSSTLQISFFEWRVWLILFVK